MLGASLRETSLFIHSPKDLVSVEIMPSSLSKSLPLSSCLKKMAAVNVTGNKQGIVSILGSDCEITKAASLRRTLSADMSSKKWLEQQGFSSSPMKKIASVDELFPVVDDSCDGEEYQERRGQLEIWSSIQQEEEKKKKELESPGQFDIWASILSQKAEQESKSTTNDPTAAPYIHPLVKRSSSSLSKKSLEICTESLGSETGSDGFSSYPPSETSELDQEDEQPQPQPQQEDWGIAKYSKKAPPRSFPPPLPSLSRGSDGLSLRMQSHRKNGRLVLEAVSFPTQNYFSAERQDGRLLLTFVNTPNTAEDQSREEYVEDGMEELGESSDEEDEYGEEEVAEEEEVIEKDSIMGKLEMEIGVGPKVAKNEVIHVHRAAVMVNKLIRLANRNPTWPKRINEVIQFEDQEEEIEPTPLSKSFPIMPPRGMVVPRLIPSGAAAAAATFNVYENCWRSKKPTTIFSSTLPLQKPPPHKNNNNNNNMFIFSKSSATLKKSNEQQQLLVKRSEDKAADYLAPMVKGCKEPRRSLLFWEPNYIATS